MGNFYVPKKWNVPLCFPSPEVFGRWREMARSATIETGDSYCADCTPAYRDRMHKQGRCEFPNTIFTRDEDGMLRGHRVLAVVVVRVDRRKRPRADFPLAAVA